MNRFNSLKRKYVQIKKHFEKVTNQLIINTN